MPASQAPDTSIFRNLRVRSCLTLIELVTCLVVVPVYLCAAGAWLTGLGRGALLLRILSGGEAQRLTIASTNRDRGT